MWVILRQEVLVRNMELTSHHQPQEFRKGQKETPCVQPPPRTLLAGIHLGWAKHAPPGRTLSQNDWWKTTWKPTPLTQNPRLWTTRQSSSPGFLYLPALRQMPLPNKVSCFVSTCVSSDNSFRSVRQKTPFQALEGVPLPATVRTLCFHCSGHGFDPCLGN